MPEGKTIRNIAIITALFITPVPMMTTCVAASQRLYDRDVFSPKEKFGLIATDVVKELLYITFFSGLESFSNTDNNRAIVALAAAATLGLLQLGVVLYQAVESAKITP